MGEVVLKNRTSRVGGRGMQACNELCTSKERARTRTVRDGGGGQGGKHSAGARTSCGLRQSCSSSLMPFP